MSLFENIHITGFRRLKDLDLPLRPLGVMIGQNGCGKTSLLDVFSLLAASASGDLREKVSEHEGLHVNLTSGITSGTTFELRMKVADDENPLVYKLALVPSGVGYEIQEETLTQQRNPEPPPFKHIESAHGDIRFYDSKSGGLTRPSWEHNPFESSLAQVPKMFQEPEDFRRQLASSTHYHVLNVDPKSPVRMPQPLRPASLPGRNGEDLVSCLFSLRESSRDRFETIEDTLRAAFPGFERLEFPPVAAGTLAMTWKDCNFSHPFYMHQLSEGSLRFLWLVTLLQSPGLTSITLLDEPEVSLHPELLSLLAELLREASDRTQLVVATHSDRLVRFLSPEEVVVLDIDEEGYARGTWADQMNLDEWLEEYSFDELWQMGRIGGRP